MSSFAYADRNNFGVKGCDCKGVYSFDETVESTNGFDTFGSNYHEYIKKSIDSEGGVITKSPGGIPYGNLLYPKVGCCSGYKRINQNSYSTIDSNIKIISKVYNTDLFDCAGNRNRENPVLNINPTYL